MEAMPVTTETELETAAAARTDARRAVPDRLRELFAQLTHGSDPALAEIYDLSAARLYGLALWTTGSREDAADVVAEVWVKLAERRERLPRVRDPRAWLYTVTRRLAIDVLRRRRRSASEPLAAAELVQSPDTAADRRADGRRAAALLAALPVRQREVVYLRHYGDCTFTEIGVIVGVTRYTAASRYRLAIHRLRRLMEVEP